MKRKRKIPINTMSPERLAKITDYLHRYAVKWSDAHQQIAEQICHAFADTVLGGGIGILEADCVDDWLDETNPERRQYRTQDKRIYWENVLFQGHLAGEIPRFNPSSALTFMDGAGRRFVLPCYLLWALQNTESLAAETLSYCLAKDFYTNDLPLNPSQQRALLVAIQFLAQTDVYEYDDGYYAECSTPWAEALAHLSQVLPDV